MKILKKFNQFLNEGNYDGIQQKLWDFQNKPLLGGYFSDVDSDQMSVFITISKNPVQPGQTRHQIEELGRAIYYPEQDKWNLEGLSYTSDRDKPILDQIAQIIKNN